MDESALAREHPLTQFGLDALVVGASRLRPEKLALIDHAGDELGALTHAELDHAIGAFVARLREFDLKPGERVLIGAAPRAQTVVALTAVLAAGLAPVLIPLHLPQELLVRGATAVSPAALFAPARFGGLEFEEKFLALAASIGSIRHLGSIGPDLIDSAVDFSAASLRGASVATMDVPDGWTLGERVMVGMVDALGDAVFATQGALLSLGLDLVRKTRSGGLAPIISLVSPASFGGLVSGPLVALLSGAPLHFLSPFHGPTFLALLDSLGPSRLVAPRAILPELSRAGLLTQGELVSCVTLSRMPAVDGFAPPEGSCPIVDILGEGAALTFTPLANRTRDAASRVA